MNDRVEREVSRAHPLTRRQFIETTATVGVLGLLAVRQAPVFAQRREVSMITWNHFVPASDERLKEIAADFSKRHNVNLRIDTIAHLQLPSKLAAEVQTKTGHDLVFMYNELPYLYEQQLVAMDDLVGVIEKKYGGLYPFTKESAYVHGSWRALPWMWISFPGTYNQSLFKQFGQPVPDTWDDLLNAGRELKKAGHPIGIAISHCGDANTTFWSVLWCYGGKILEADGRTVAIKSDQTERVIEWYKELYRDAMEPEVLSWDDASNNRCILAGKCSWIHNPISPYAAALAKSMPIADEINHHSSPAGPAGTHSAPPINGIGIWNFSKNISLAKDFIRFLFQKENYEAWIAASNAFNHPPLKHLADHPIWSKNPKLAMLPKEAEYAHERGWPAKPSAAVQLVQVNYVLPDMVAKAVNGMPTKRAMDWGQEQVRLAVQGKLKEAGAG